MLHQALLGLMREKNYESISVADICERANVGRSTFYAHYPTKDDLKRSGLDHLRKLLADRTRVALEQSPGAELPPLAFSLPMLEHARDHSQLYHALIGSRGGAVAMETIRGFVAELVATELSRSKIRMPPGTPKALVIEFLVGAYMAVLRWWLEEGCEIPVTRVDEIFRNQALTGLAYFKQ